MSTTQDARQRSLADAQELSGCHTKVIRGKKSRIIDFAWISPQFRRTVLDAWQTEIVKNTRAQSLFF